MNPTKPPRYDPKTKRVSLETTFGVDIRLKFIAHREAWLRAWESLDFDNLTFAEVKPFLSRNPRKAVEALAELAEKNHYIFAADFLNCVLAANSQNPLFGPATKPRGGSPSGIDWETRNKVSRLALKLNHILRAMRQAHFKDWPAYFRKFHQKYFIGTGTPFKATEFPSVIAKALSAHLALSFGENLWDTFVKRRGLTLNRLEERQCLLPLADPDLSELFSNFQN